MLKVTDQSSKPGLQHKLQQVKALIQNLFSSRLSSGITGWQVKNNSTKYNKKIQIQKQNNVLIYQFGLLANLLHRLDIHDTDQIFVLNKGIYDKQIQLKQIVSDKEKQMITLQIKLKQLIIEKQNIQKQCNRVTKNFQICQKKMNILQGNNERNKINLLEMNLKQLQDKFDKSIKEGKKYKDDFNKLQIKCKILEELNQQTQNQVSNFMVYHQVANVEKGESQKQNQNSSNFLKQTKNYRLEYMSAKQQIKSLKQKINELQNKKLRDRTKQKSKGKIQKR